MKSSPAQLMRTDTAEWSNIYAYGCGSQADTITRGREVLDYDYDSPLVTAISQSGTLTEQISFAYNNDLQLEAFTYAGITKNLVYDDDGLLTGSGVFTLSRNAENGLPESVSDNTHPEPDV